MPGPRRKNLIGQRFSRLVVLSYLSTDKRGALWLCRCDCGAEHSAVTSYLIRGSVRSCGCLARDINAEPRHGLTGAPVWLAWHRMMRRCYKPSHDKYKDYGGRGITVCPRWHVFENFLADMGHPPAGTTIDRYPDNDGNYGPSNCRWATTKQQACNRRTSALFTYNDETLCVVEWADRYGFEHETLRHRLRRHPIEKALTMPVRPSSRRGVKRAAVPA